MRGANACQISRLTGIPRTTIRDWLNGDPLRAREPRDPSTPRELLATRSNRAYAYLLGLYLGDGHLVQVGKGVFRLRITLDARYPGIVLSAKQAISEMLPRNVVKAHPARKGAAYDVTGEWKRWPVLIPQHGQGRKHARKIWLADWQLEITLRHARELVRGLIHSDGCRFLARQPRRGRIYSYPRYCFRNYSADIIGIFCQHLNHLGIEWTLAGPTQVQIARRPSVRALDQFVGPKL